MNTKTCTKCGITKPLNDYHAQKKGLYGKCAQCKECKRANNRAWHKANKERRRVYDLAKYQANPEKHRANARARHETNRERSRANARAWREANPEQHKANVYARRARLAHTVPQRWKRTTCPDHLCYWCGITLTPDNTHIDHIMPISLGGQDTPDNTANTCAKCNQSKSNAHPLVWLARITTPDTVC